MTTLADQRIPAKTWTVASGMTTSTSYSIQNKAEFAMFVFEDSSPPSAANVGVKVLPDNKYQFTKSSDNVYIYMPNGAGTISKNVTT